MTKNKKAEDLEKEVAELTSDLQRTRADFENYRKRVEAEKQSAHELGQTKSVNRHQCEWNLQDHCANDNPLKNPLISSL
jgi:predicted  nucleic acid-binding Zn-ribbon protein